MFDEVQPLMAESAVVFATADDLLTVADLPERNVTIRRWHKNGKPLTIRVRALDLDQQDRITQAAMIKNNKTGAWEQSVAAFNAATLHEALTTPKLTAEQARAMRQHNPIIIQKLVDFIWSLAALDDATIEQYARTLAPSDTPQAEGDTPSE